jgi:hypothetical protein
MLHLTPVVVAMSLLSLLKVSKVALVIVCLATLVGIQAHSLTHR